MIYEESEIIELLKCEHCIQPYDGYYDPRMLHCCGKTVCNTCVQLALKRAEKSRFKWIACNKLELMPENRF